MAKDIGNEGKKPRKSSDNSVNNYPWLRNATDRGDIRRFVREGRTIKDIANYFGTKAGRVESYLHDHGLLDVRKAQQRKMTYSSNGDRTPDYSRAIVLWRPPIGAKTESNSSQPSANDQVSSYKVSNESIETDGQENVTTGSPQSQTPSDPTPARAPAPNTVSNRKPFWRRTRHAVSLGLAYHPSITKGAVILGLLAGTYFGGTRIVGFATNRVARIFGYGEDSSVPSASLGASNSRSNSSNSPSKKDSFSYKGTATMSGLDRTVNFYYGENTPSFGNPDVMVNQLQFYDPRDPSISYRLEDIIDKLDVREANLSNIPDFNRVFIDRIIVGKGRGNAQSTYISSGDFDADFANRMDDFYRNALKEVWGSRMGRE